MARKTKISSAIYFLSHQKLPFYILPLLMVILVLGTVAQRSMGLFEAQKQFFFSFILWLGPVPFPGTLTLLGILLLGLILKFVFYSPWQWKRSGINLAHLGVLILLVGGVVTIVDKQESNLVLFEKDKSNSTIDADNNKTVYTLPFSVTLLKFTKDFYPGTDKAKNYSSDVEITDGKITWPARIEMNEPLRYKGYTLFQSSFIQTKNGKEATVLSVVKNRGWLFPYLGTIVMSFGLLLHFLMAKKRT